MKPFLFVIGLIAATLLSSQAIAADELWIEEYPRNFLAQNNELVPIYPPVGESYTMDANDSATQLNSNTYMLRICNISASAVYYKIGSSGVTAGAATDNSTNQIALASACIDQKVSPSQYIDTAQ